MPRTVGTPWKIDLSGKRFGSWTVIERVKYATWLCRCDCGNENILQGSSLTIGKSTQCVPCSNKAKIHHGMEGTRIYNVWAGMKQRCNNPKYHAYAMYGGRGITACERWTKFENFYADMGEAPKGKTLGRIDNDGPYSPDNCRWETNKQQIRNRRNTSFVEWQGVKRSVADLAEEHKVPVKLVRDRLAVGWSIGKALTTPSRKS